MTIAMTSATAPFEPIIRSADGVPSAVSADLLKPAPRLLLITTLTLAMLVVAAVVWSAFAAIEEVSQGRGRIIPSSKLQVVQNLEGGIVRELLVHEGQHVKAGDVLIRIDPTHFDSSLGEAREKIAGLEVLVARLEAEVDGHTPIFSPEVSQARPDLVDSQRSLYESRVRELEAGLAALDRARSQRAQEILETEARIRTLEQGKRLASEELAILRPLERTRAVARSDVLLTETKLNEVSGALEAARLALPRIRSALEEATSKHTERASSFRSDALTKLGQARVEHRALLEQTRGAADRVARTVVRAPVSGIIKTVNVSTVGQVVQPGSPLMDIVPLNDALLVEAQVRPQDIAFLHPGQKAIVKITAYDFGIYGGLEARVEHIGADSVTPEKGEPYYPVRVRTNQATLTYRGETLPIMAGMVADVDIKTGSKTVMQYILKPFTRLRAQSLRER